MLHKLLLHSCLVWGLLWMLFHVKFKFTYFHIPSSSIDVLNTFLIQQIILFSSLFFSGRAITINICLLLNSQRAIEYVFFFYLFCANKHKIAVFSNYFPCTKKRKKEFSSYLWEIAADDPLLDVWGNWIGK